MLIERLKKWVGLGPPDQLKAPPFPKLAAAYQKRLSRWPAVAPSNQDGPTVSILVTPWLGTPLPFFNMEVALLLADAGCRVSLLWDAADLVGNAAGDVERSGIAETLPHLPSWIRVIDIADHPGEGGPASLDDAWIDGMLFENGVWRMRGEESAESYVKRKRSNIDAIRQHISRVEAVLRNESPSLILIPGGVWGLTPIYVALCERAGWDFATYDAGFATLTLCRGGIACHQSDIMKALSGIGHTFSEAEQQAILARASQELSDRTQGRGNYENFQVRAASDTVQDFNVLVPLNQRWDAAALARQRFFPTVNDWLVALMRWAEREPRARVCIRQHPVERSKVWRGSDDIGALVQRENRAGERVRFVAAEESISTYELLRGAKVVSPYTSSVGVEAGMLGIPVVTSAKCYYENAPFAWRPETEDEYFQLLSQALNGELLVSEETRRAAAFTYYLVQDCNLMPTNFSPTPVEFQKWVQIEPSQLWKHRSVQVLKEALLTGAPLSLLWAREMNSAKTAA